MLICSKVTLFLSCGQICLQPLASGSQLHYQRQGHQCHQCHPHHHCHHCWHQGCWHCRCQHHCCHCCHHHQCQHRHRHHHCHPNCQCHHHCHRHCPCCPCHLHWSIISKPNDTWPMISKCQILVTDTFIVRHTDTSII